MTTSARRFLFSLQTLLMLVLALGTTPAMAQTEIRYVHTDAMGSVVALSDEQGNIVERFEYEPYGVVLNQPAHDGIGYTGHVADAATGLVYMQERYYDPVLGRMTSVDPVVVYGGNLQHFNRYAYGYNNPYRYTDPDGRAGLDWSARYRGTLEMAGGNQQIANQKMAQGLSIGLAGAGAVAVGAPLASQLGWAALTNPRATTNVIVGIGEIAGVAGVGAIGATGKVGESALKALGGQSQVHFRTSQGARFIDQLANGVAHESKVGYQALTKDIQRQISKDAELLQTERIQGATWHFFQSPATGIGGPSKPLMDALQRSNIDVINH